VIDSSHRVARRDDLPQIVEIYNSTVASRMVTADLDPVSVESRIGWFEQHSPRFRPLWVIETQGTIAAWLSFSSFYGRPAYDTTAEMSVYVRDTVRGQGLGSRLLSAAIGHAPTIGLRTLMGFIFAHNQPSLKLFARHGFERWGELPGIAVLEGVERDVVIVGRRVHEP
jgi:phosphinothricin acetyltransferase